MNFKLEDNRFIYKAVEMARLYAPPHLHSQLEIVCLKSGNATCIIDKTEYQINTGDIAVIFPGQVHSYNNSPNSIDLLLASPEILKEFNGCFQNYLPQNPIISADAVNDVLRGCINKLISTKTGTLSLAEAKGYFLVLLSETIRCLSLVKNGRRYTDTEKSILSYCEDHFREELTLDTIAKAIGIGKYTVSRFFSSLGICLNDYINSHRLEFACKSLTKDDLSISEIAYESGFGSIRTFNRSFLKHMGTSPREYRYRHTK